MDTNCKAQRLEIGQVLDIDLAWNGLYDLCFPCQRDLEGVDVGFYFCQPEGIKVLIILSETALRYLGQLTMAMLEFENKLVCVSYT